MSADTNSETQSNEQADVWLTPDQVDAMRDVAIDTGAKYLRQRNETIKNCTGFGGSHATPGAVHTTVYCPDAQPFDDGG